MKRTLYIVRHAQAVDHSLRIDDFSRDLTEQGRSEATEIGNYLSQQKIQLQEIISSSAHRTSSTAFILAERLQFDTKKIILKDEMYQASVKLLLDIISNLSDDLYSVMLVGHNPSISQLVDYLSMEEEIEHFPTCTVAALQFELDSWKKIDKDTGILLFLQSPF